MFWKLNLALAKYLGMWRYDGLFWRTPWYYPLAKVRYEDGNVSIKMGIGNAVEYTKIFDGKVIKP